ncbi:MAG: hypothetical protein LBS11_08390 [Oscillospiraceae bacterium]|jgi:hypothetical protein|nr:hypothetical protein [Oscillospiraceae bacterium]
MTIGIRNANNGESPLIIRTLTRCTRRAVPPVIALAVIVAALLRSTDGVDPRLLLSGSGRMGIEPYAFYVTGSVVVSPEAAASYESAARRAFLGSNVLAFESGVTQSGVLACVAASAVTVPNAREAMEAVRRVKAALGPRSRVALCLTGHTNEPAGVSDQDGVKAAVLDNGDVYLGTTWIPITY